MPHVGFYTSRQWIASNQRIGETYRRLPRLVRPSGVMFLLLGGATSFVPPTRAQGKIGGHPQTPGLRASAKRMPSAHPVCPSGVMFLFLGSVTSFVPPTGPPETGGHPQTPGLRRVGAGRPPPEMPRGPDCSGPLYSGRGLPTSRQPRVAAVGNHGSACLSRSARCRPAHGSADHPGR
jgi:hypothetical protein